MALAGLRIGFAVYRYAAPSTRNSFAAARVLRYWAYPFPAPQFCAQVCLPARSGGSVRAPLPENEQQRLQALYSEHILDTGPEQPYDDLVKQASFICNTPISTISLIDPTRQWFKAKVGVEGRETPREQAFCAHTILEPEEVLIVEDATKDARFADNPLVTGEMNIRFYAGVPLVTQDGHALGSLCVIDTVPRKLTDRQLEALKVCRNQVLREMELRRKTAALTHSLGLLEESQQKLHASEQRYRELVNRSLGLLCVHDMTGKILLANPAAHDALGLGPEELRGKNLVELLAPVTRPSFAQYLNRIRDNHADSGLMRLITKGGEERTWLYRNVLRVDEDGEAQVIGHAQDVTDSRRMEETLRKQVAQDPLTKLFNRRYLEDAMTREIRKAARRKRSVAVLMIDVDHYKRYNDAYGHAVGDLVLITLANFLKNGIRAEDIACRYGGDEFALVLNEATAEGARGRAEALVAKVKELRFTHEARVIEGFTLSVGIATYPENGATLAELMDAADKALYHAKRDGRDRVCVAEGVGTANAT
jgi:diguanylate cyclase (GGDEF)-like protein/PAS domain S-box-containing protein